MIICSSSNIDLIQGVSGYGNPEGITDWRIANTLSGASGNLNIFNSISQTSRLTILENGNVGIGNINPGSILDIGGDVNITGVYKKGSRDVINDTSNYLLTTSNILVSRILTEVGFGSNYINKLATSLNTRVDDTSNYVVAASNVVTTSVNSQWTNVSHGIYYTPTTAESLPYAITSSPVATTIGATGDYTYMSFTYTTETAGAGTGQTQYTLNVPSGGAIFDILVVGGGGAGGGRAGGGGGAGGVLYREGISLSGSITIKVGNGGVVGTASNGDTSQAPGLSGYNSSIGALYIAAGGGGGGGNAPHLSGRAIDLRGKDGGSGGGNCSSAFFSQNDSTNGYNGNPNTFIVGKTLKNNNYSGNNGGKGISDGGSTWTGGGGGGAGAAGGNAGYNSKGGDGIPIRITGSSVYYGGGGGGGANNASAIRITDGGLGGGGNGTAYAGNAFPGISGTGGGGGGGGFSSDSPSGYGGAGGSGIVIIRYLSSTKNVGIGTTNPSTELHVYDDTTNNTVLKVQNDYIDNVAIYPNTVGYTVAETVESSKFYRTITFNYFPNYPEDPPNTSLLAWYRLNGDGLDYNPYSTKYNLIANSGTPTYSSGTTTDSFLQGRRYINTSAGSLRSTTLSLASRAFSIALWVRPKSTSDTVFIGQTASIGVNISLHIGWRENNAHFFGFFGNDINCGTGVSGNPTTYPGDANTWVHMVYVVLPNYNRRVYRNGVLISTDSNTTAFSGSGDLKIGANYGTNASQNVDFSDLRIYSNGLSAAEVATLYASYTNLVITDNYAINFNKLTTLLVNGSSKTVNGLYNISMGHINSSILPAGGQTEIPLASTALTTLPIKYEYTNTSVSLPALITVSGATSSFIGSTERAISFTYTSDSLGLTGQTQYTFTPAEDLWCDILVVGGGGGGGHGGGGGGGVLLGTNLKINGGSSVSVKVGNGGTGMIGGGLASAVNGVNGFNSSITINSIEYISVGGGGGGTRENIGACPGRSGNTGGSGGGGSHANVTPYGLGGVSIKNNYTNFQSFGNNGGLGRPGTSGSEPNHTSGGGGGAGSAGNDFSYTIGGGNGGKGKEFISYFGTNVGHNGYFGGGGGGQTAFGSGNRGYGNGGLGLYGGGGDSANEYTPILISHNGLSNTGGGGGGGRFQGDTYTLSGGKGGSGFIIIRYRKIITQSASLELITSSSINISEPTTTFDRINKNTGMTGWVQIKHLPGGAETGNRTWFSGNTFSGSTVNSYTVGSPSNNAAEWSIPFDSARAQFYLFYENTNDFNGEWNDRWIVMRKSDMTEVYYPNWKPFYKASSYPNGKTEGLQYNRVNAGQEWDPNIGLGHEHTRVDGVVNTSGPYKYTNAVYIENSATGWNGAPPSEVNVYVKYTEDIPITIPRELSNYNYKYMSFTHSGGTEAQTSYTVNFPENTVCDILIVGGGGAGGTYIGGGGGGGGVLYIQNATIPIGTYNILVGNGGTGFSGAGVSTTSQNGTSSKAFGIEVFGGGYGGSGGWGTGGNGQTGGSGGSGGAGGSADGNTGFSRGVGGSITQPSFTNSVITVNTYNYYGGIGATSITYNGNAGGWVGANGGGGAGGNAPANTDQANAGAGADGIAINITGTSYFWGGGGGGGQYAGGKAGNGGKGGGGGGNGSQVSEGVGIGGIGGITLGQNGDLEGDGTPTAGNGGAGTGGGGGGTGRTTGSPNAISGSGGSGIVIISYKSTKIGNRGYKIGNYNGDFKIISSTSSPSSSITTNTDFMRITRDGASIYNPTGSPLWSTTSDMRIKENIERASYDKCYDNINKLDLYRFNYIRDFNNINKDLKQLGYIAQEVQGIFPKAVSTEQFNNNNLNVPDLLTIDITQINYSLYGAVKKLMEMYNDIENQISIVEKLLNIDTSITNTSNLIETDISTSNLIETDISTSNLTIEDISTSNLTIDNISTSNLTIDNISTSNLTIDNISTSNLTIDNI
jgi:hypothetical protein